MVRSYTGDTQTQAALRYAEDAPALAAEGWIPVSQAWVEGEWPTSMYVVATILVLFIIGIFLLFAMAFFKPKRILLVTYSRPTRAS